MRSMAGALHVGPTITYSYVSYARTPTHAELQLVQGERVALLDTRWLGENYNPSYDPRTRRTSAVVRVTPAMLRDFHDGPATVRVIGVSGQQWLRTPRPNVTVQQVEVQTR
jgi:hypothetical protein